MIIMIHNLLYTIKDEYSNILNSIELNYNNLLLLNNSNLLKLVYFNKIEEKEVKNELKNVNKLLISIFNFNQ